MSLAHVSLEDASGWDADEARALEHVQSLLSREDVDAARQLIQGLARRWPASAAVQRMAEVLAHPQVTSVGKQRSRKQEMAWLRQNARRYPGCWIALHGETLIAADPDVAQVKAAIRNSPYAADALLHFQPGSMAPK